MFGTTALILIALASMALAAHYRSVAKARQKACEEALKRLHFYEQQFFHDAIYEKSESLLQPLRASLRQLVGEIKDHLSILESAPAEHSEGLNAERAEIAKKIDEQMQMLREMVSSSDNPLTFADMVKLVPEYSKLEALLQRCTIAR